jgi:hypothetical protein
MARRIWLSILALLVAFCIGLSLIALSGAVLLVQSNIAAPVEVVPTPEGSNFYGEWAEWR